MQNVQFHAQNGSTDTMTPNGLPQAALSEVEFNQMASATLARIEQGLEEADLDFETPADGIIEVEFDDGSKLIINRHGVAREIWVAARSGGFHFKAHDGDWIDTKDGTPLFKKLAALVALQGDGIVAFPTA
jgi:CyaY protein